MNPAGYRLVDLSAPLEKNEGEPARFAFRRIAHREGADRFGRSMVFSRHKGPFGFLRAAAGWLSGKERLSSGDFPDGEFINQEWITASTHTGTHMDAPFHYGTKSGGQPAVTVDQIPLEWCAGPGILLDLRWMEPGGRITPAILERALARIGHMLSPGEIVLLHTGASRFWGKPGYLEAHPGLDRAAAAYLLERGARVIGTDAYGLDRPFRFMAEEYFKTRDASVLFPAHLYGRVHPYCQVERMANLGALPAPTGFYVFCFPIRITGAGAAWCRAVALIPEEPGDTESLVVRQG